MSGGQFDRAVASLTEGHPKVPSAPVKSRERVQGKGNTARDIQVKTGRSRKLSDPVVPVEGQIAQQSKHQGWHRLIPQSSHRRECLLLVSAHTILGAESRSQEFGCSPIKEYTKLGSKNVVNGLDLSAVGVGERSYPWHGDRDSYTSSYFSNLFCKGQPGSVWKGR